MSSGDELEENEPDNDVNVPEQLTMEVEIEEISGPQTKKAKLDLDETCTPEGNSCLICFDVWTTSGEHRLCATKCGHLFGHSCILRWVKTNKTCPTCKLKCVVRDLRFIYASKITSADNEEVENLRLELDKKISENNKLQIEIVRLQSQLDLCKVFLNEKSSQSTSTANKYMLDFKQNLQVCSVNGSCRLVVYSKHTSEIFISKTSQNNLFTCHGIQHFDSNTLRQKAFTALHNSLIRDIKLNDSQLLSVSNDKFFKVSDLRTKESVYKMEQAGCLWSCQWNSSNFNQFYVGDYAGSVTLFDMRKVNEAVKVYGPVTGAGANAPVVSIQGVSENRMYVCKLTSAWEYKLDEDIQMQLPVEGPFTSMSYDTNREKVLLTARPSANNSGLRHIIAGYDSDSRFRLNTTIYADFVPVMTRSTFIQNGEQVLGVDGAQVGIWCSETGRKLASGKSPADSGAAKRHILDVCALNDNCIGTLNESALNIYRLVNSV